MKTFFYAAAAVAATMPLSLLPSLHAQDTTTHTVQVQMVPATAVLSKSLDAKKAKQGDMIMAKLDKDVKLDDTTTLPKDTLLVGKVGAVQPSQNKGESTIEVTFDQVQMKDGKTMPIKATVMQVAKPANGAMLAAEGANPNGPAPIPPSGTPMSGGTAGNPGGSAMQNPGAMPTKIVDHSNDKGVTLRSDIHDKDSGTFTDKKKNVHLASGTQLDFALASIPAGTTMQ